LNDVAAGQRIAIVDGASFVLPYDYQLVRALAQRGAGIDVYVSDTAYNRDFLDALRALPNVEVIVGAVSGSVAPRWRGVPAYVALWARLWRRRARYGVVNLQFSVLWPLELAMALLLRRRFVLTLHNPVPHEHAGRRHGPTAWLARLARRIVFVSAASRDDFVERYGAAALPAARSALLPHGLLPVVPQAGATPYAPPAQPPRTLAYWSTVKPYKGVELYAELARSAQVAQRGLALEIHGRWDRALLPLRDELAGLGVRIVDAYLDRAALLALMAAPALFVLPYRRASQSGALYSLLNHGRLFVCADVGDLGRFMRAHGLDKLLLRDRSAAALLECLDHIAAHPQQVAQAFAAAQEACRWECIVAAGAWIYEGGAAPGG